MPRLLVLTLLNLSIFVQAQMPVSDRHCRLDRVWTIRFADSGSRLDRRAMDTFALAAQMFRNNPDCRIKVVGFGLGLDRKAELAAWSRVEAVMDYIIRKQEIPPSRLLFDFPGEVTDPATVRITGADPQEAVPPLNH